MSQSVFRVAAVWLVVGVAPAHAAIRYSITDLGDLSGGENSSQAFALNSTGQVVGISEATGGTRAFLWQNGVMTDLGVLTPEHEYSVPHDINDTGDVVGQSVSRAFLYSGGTMIDIGTLGGDYGIAGGINNLGQIVGISSDSNGVTHAFRWSNGTMIDLDSQTGGYSRAYGINELSQITGVSASPPDAISRGFLWQNGQMTDLGDLFGGSGHTTAFAINNLGQVVGYSGLVGSTGIHPFIWQDGVMTDLGSLSAPTASGYARGINNLGNVVGMSGNHPFIWNSVAGMRDLNDLLDGSGNGWLLSRAYDVNDRGQIVGFGRNPDGFSHGFLLTPIPEPSSFIVWCFIGVTFAGIGWGWRRRAA